MVALQTFAILWEVEPSHFNHFSARVELGEWAVVVGQVAVSPRQKVRI